MCNRFAVLPNLADIEALAETLGLALTSAQISPQVDIFADTDVPVLRQVENTLSFAPLRWGLPPIPGHTTPITNIRNLNSRWWRETNREYCLSPRYRCLVPFTAFAEPARNSTWFGTDVAQPCFAGIWHLWRGERLATIPGQKRRVRTMADWQLFAFLTCTANSIVHPVHDTMPVILTTPGEMKIWLAGGPESFTLQRPLPDTRLHIRPTAQIPGLMHEPAAAPFQPRLL